MSGRLRAPRAARSPSWVVDCDPKTIPPEAVFRQARAVDKGEIAVPDASGLGVQLDMDSLLAAHELYRKEALGSRDDAAGALTVRTAADLSRPTAGIAPIAPLVDLAAAPVGTTADSARTPSRPSSPRSGQGDRFEEVAGQQNTSPGAQEVGPRTGTASRRGIDPGLLQDLPYRASGHLDPGHKQFVMHPPAAPRGILPSQAQCQGADGVHSARPARALQPRTGRVVAPDP